MDFSSIDPAATDFWKKRFAHYARHREWSDTDLVFPIFFDTKFDDPKNLERSIESDYAKLTVIGCMDIMKLKYPKNKPPWSVICGIYSSDSFLF
jgi:hypothetical protein